MESHNINLTRTPLLAEGVLDRARGAGVGLIKKVIRTLNIIKRARTPEFVRHCVIAISQSPDKVAQIKRKGSVHGVCRATFERNKAVLTANHPKGSHHTTDAYHAAADRIGESGDN